MDEEISILIIDDNKDFADVFCDMLKSNKYKANCCYGGRQAIEILRNCDVDIIFLDIRMPGMDGLETLKQIKKICPKTRVIMMTGYSVDEMVHKAIEQNVSDVIYKPFEMDKVLSIIKNKI